MPAPQDPGGLNHLTYRVVDAVRTRRGGQPPPPVRQRGRVESLVVQRHPGRDLPPQVTTGSLRRLRIRVVQQGLQRQNRRRHRPGQRPATLARWEQVREIRVREQIPAMLGQEREHAARRYQVPDHRGGVEELPVGTLYTLHTEILSSLYKRVQKTRPLFSAFLGSWCNSAHSGGRRSGRWCGWVPPAASVTR